MTLLTEEQAKATWCHAARTYDFEEFRDGVGMASVNRTSEGAPPGQCNCLASGCSQWVEVEPAVHDAKTGLMAHPALGMCGQNMAAMMLYLANRGEPI